MLITSRSVHQQASYLTDHQPGVRRAYVRILRARRGPGDIWCRGLRDRVTVHHRLRRTLVRVRQCVTGGGVIHRAAGAHVPRPESQLGMAVS